MKKVFLTGASGYIGKHITLELLNQGYEVRASVRSLKRSGEVRNAVLPYLTDKSNLENRLTFVELDLTKSTGWNEALMGIDVLIHSASPFTISSPKDENELIKPAVDGTLLALKAAHLAGVKRVILTSSVVAIYGNNLPSGKTSFDESMWSDINHPVGRRAYTKSKTLAERAAWEFIKVVAPEIEMTTINPVLVLGAPLDNLSAASVSVVDRIFEGKDPMLPDLSFSIVDVRDVARMHVDSIKAEATKGERIIASAGMLSFVEIAKILKSKFPEKPIKTIQAPNFIMRILSLFDGEIRAVLPLLGDRTPVSSLKAEKLLGVKFVLPNASVIATGEYLAKR